MFLLFVDSINSFFTDSPLFLSLVVITNVAPNFAKPFAVSLPIPDVAPVIITIFDFRRNHFPIIFNMG
jgi:hypothetical protein